MWIYLILIITIIIIVCLLTLWDKLIEKGIIITAKIYFNKLISTNQATSERTKEECELKMSILLSCKITYSTGWLIFWFFFGFGIGFIICLVIGFSNKSTRMFYKEQELTRLQNKINNFVKIEIAKNYN